MRYPVRLSVAIMTISLCALLADGCGDGDDGAPSKHTYPTEHVIGPAGGTIEVTDPNSYLKGVRITFPPGAVAQTTTIRIEEAWDIPSLPAGLSAFYVPMNFVSSTTFSKDVEITFPVQLIPTADGDILGAYYWNTAKAKWTIIPARQVKGNKITITTRNSGLFWWGIARLSELDDDTVVASMEEMQSMFDAWINLKQAIESRLNPLMQLLANPTPSRNVTRCDTQNEMLSTLASLREDALQGVADYLATPAVVNNCKICDLNNNCVASACDANELISGQPIEWLRKEVQIYFDEIYWSATCPIDLLGPICGKMVAWAKYQEAIRSLGCDWRCILANGNLDFYSDLLMGNVCSFSIFAIELYRTEHPCP
jgi:hypothetical protein